MTEKWARSILRLFAVLTVLVGISMALVKFFTYIGTNRAMGGMFGNFVSQFSTYSILGDVAVAGLGFLLFAFSSKLAALVVE